MPVQWKDLFPIPAAEDWVHAIQKSVKDPAELEKIIWNTYEGFSLNAFYLDHTIPPAKVPLPAATTPAWEIRQLIFSDKIMAANQAALKALENGAGALYFKGNYAGNEKELDALFKGIHLDWIPVHFDMGESNVAWIYVLADYFATHNYPMHAMRGSVNYDPLSQLLITGNFDYPLDETQKVFASILTTASNTLPGFKVININAHWVREAGGSAVHELAAALACAVEYTHWATEQNIPVETVWKHMQFNLGIGNDYFIEIAKFRAFRLLFERLASAYQVEMLPYVHAANLEYNKTVYDPHNNLLRATTEAMSAAIGGCDAITLRPFDESHKMPEEFSYRMSRNIQLLLQEEAHLDKTTDPAAGSYYIEQATHKLVNAAWDLFVSMEKEGGIINSLTSKKLQQQIEQTARAKNTDFLEGKLVLVGTNKYMNKAEKKSGEYARLHSSGLVPDRLLILPVKPYRLSEKMEVERLKLEASSVQLKN